MNMTMPMSVFQLKEDEAETVRINRNEVQEIVPDADFRFSLIMLKDGRKYFVCGTLEELDQEFEKPTGSD
ncbi:hypothetical protein GCM10007423_10940 [Dyadobacter endophyticus]|uniref:Uncharacterized protein n=2 Tax=Dyadobacter endophyticus TaxID=1749036 RepID=A0ABQ1YIR8_9BACT|nr:hypothetical protein GCM10007423_10940 [Dyadobacter endophyticus]